MLSEKFFIIIGVVVIGVIATFLGNGDLSAVALGGLVGYLSKDVGEGKVNLVDGV